MMLSTAFPQGNRMILLNNGFILLDKFVRMNIPGPKDSNHYLPCKRCRTGKEYRYDLAQMEFHTIGRDNVGQC